VSSPRFSKAKNEDRDPDPGDGSDPYAILAAEVFPRYDAALRAYNAVDFDDLLLLTLRLFRQHPEVLEQWRKRVATSSSMSFRTPMPCSTGSLPCSPARKAT